MTNNKKYFWLKLKADFFDEDAIAWLEEQENGEKYSLFYLKLCLKALNTDGLLIRNVGSLLIPYDVKTLAKITNADVDTVRVAMDILTKIGLVQVLENGELFLPQVPTMIGSETNYARQKRQQRIGKKNEIPALEDNQKTIEDNKKTMSMSKVDNVHVEGGQCPLHCPVEIEKEKEIDKELDIDIDIHTKKEEVSKYVCNENLKEISKLFQSNIGAVNPVMAEWLIEICDTVEPALFKKAIEIASDKGKCNAGYVKGIIKNFLNKNITTLEQLEASVVQEKKVAATSSTKSQTKTKFHNFEETFTKYTEEELNQIIAKSQSEKFVDEDPGEKISQEEIDEIMKEWGNSLQ